MSDSNRYFTWADAESLHPGCTVLFDIQIPPTDRDRIIGLRLSVDYNNNIIAEGAKCSGGPVGAHHSIACDCWIYIDLMGAWRKR